MTIGKTIETKNVEKEMQKTMNRPNKKHPIYTHISAVCLVIGTTLVNHYYQIHKRLKIIKTLLLTLNKTIGNEIS